MNTHLPHNVVGVSEGVRMRFGGGATDRWQFLSTR